MKSAIIFSVSLALASTTVLAEEPDPFKPSGRLNVHQKMVRQGVYPQIDWEISYPLKVTEIVEIDPKDDSITPKMRSLMEVRVVGAGFQIGTKHTNVAVQTKIGGSSWKTLFNDPDYNVHPAEVLLSQVVEPGTRIDFSARAQKTSGSWYSSRNTLGEDPTVQALINGASVPQYLPAYDQGDVASFLSQYINADHEITVGPRDVIYLYELYATDPTSSYFDMQDVVVVVSFKDVPEPE